MTPADFRAGAAAAYEAEKARWFVYGDQQWVSVHRTNEQSCVIEKTEGPRHHCDAVITEGAMQAMLRWMAENFDSVDGDNDEGLNARSFLQYLATDGGKDDAAG